MDNAIQLLNTQYDIAPQKDHDEEITLIYQYLIDKFGDTSTTAFKLHEVLISLVIPAKRVVSTTNVKTLLVSTAKSFITFRPVVLVA